jgi:peptide/nickel transport system permease protein
VTALSVEAAAETPEAALAVTASTAAGRRPGRILPALAGTVVIGWVVAAVAWPWLAPDDPSAQDPGAVFAAPGRGHLLGADSFGRDVLSRVLAGSREVLVIAPLSVALAIVVGTAVGLAIGYRGGVTDTVTMRILEAVAVLPPLFPVVLAAALLGSSDVVLVVVIAFAFTPLVTWTVRSATLVEREKQYVEAARLRGERGPYIATREILPNIAAPITVEATVRLADAIFAIATLSFVGLGAPPGSPDWGAQVAENRVFVQNAWWTVVFPALAVASLVIAVSLVADAVRERRS